MSKISEKKTPVTIPEFWSKNLNESIEDYSEKKLLQIDLYLVNLQ
jgi:hypothetical protein